MQDRSRILDKRHPMRDRATAISSPYGERPTQPGSDASGGGLDACRPVDKITVVDRRRRTN